MTFIHITPISADKQRLFYRVHYEIQKGRVGGYYKGPTYIPPKGNKDKGLYRLLEIDNVTAVIRLYRFFTTEYRIMKERGEEYFDGYVLKNDLMWVCFSDCPTITKSRVGRLLRMVVPYHTNFQQNPGKGNDFKGQMFWRWSHPLDISLGLEHLMTLWLPQVIKADGGKCETAEDFKEELEVLLGQNAEDDYALTSVIINKRLY